MIRTSVVDIQAQTHRCPNCSAPIAWNPTISELSCEHCGHREKASGAQARARAPGESVVPGAATIAEHDLDAALRSTLAAIVAARGARQGLGTITRTATCAECGASVAFPAGVAATHCAFCGSSQIAVRDARSDMMCPESIVPFAVDQAGAQSRFKSWLKSLWFRPRDLSQQARLAEIVGVYLPYWTFDAKVDSSWSAEAGHHYYTGSGKNRRRHTRWQFASGERSDAYDDWLICASKGVPDELAARLVPFDTAKLQPYSPDYLAGWRAEEYQIDLESAWRLAKGQLESSQLSRCASDVPGDTHRNLVGAHRFSQLTFKHVLLPVFVAAYRYKSKIYRFLVNAQTGEVVGHAPWSWWKIALLLAAIVVVASTFAYMTR